MSWKDYKVSGECLGVAYHAEENCKYIISTPYKVACEMVELIPEELFVPETKFLNIFSKSGQILLAIKNRLMESEAMIKRFPDVRRRQLHIVWHQLYGLCLTERCVDSTAFMLYGTAWNNYNNLVRCDNLISLVKEDQNKALEFIHKNFKEYNEFLEESEDTGEIMKFGVVIGNPPYNNDMYIPFVELGHKLSEKCSVFITPAKWQAKGGNLNESFRKNIVPYMSKIVYYPNACDIFDIAEPGGISYYLIDKEKHNSRYQAVVCDNNEFSEQMHQTNDTYLYNSIINHIIKNTTVRSIQCRLTRRTNSNSFLRQYYLHESYKPFHAVKDESNNIEVMSGGNIKGYCNKNELYTIENIEKYKVITPVMVSAGVWACIPNYGTSPLTKLKPYQVPIGSYPIIAFFDTEEECNSFLSYCNTKLVKLLHYIGISGTTESSEFWRFIPDPGAFDHIFTDEELYRKYNLTKDEINILESVIKERK